MAGVGCASRPGGDVRARHDGCDECPVGASGRPDRRGDHRGVRGPDRDRPPGPGLAVRPDPSPATAAGAAGAAVRGAGTDGSWRPISIRSPNPSVVTTAVRPVSYTHLTLPTKRIV